MSEEKREPRTFKIPVRLIVGSEKVVYLGCSHCDGAALKLMGYGAATFARTITGRLICEECDKKRVRGEPLPNP